MQRILSIEEIRKADQYTIEMEPIASIDLMERAAHLCYEWIIAHVSPELKIHVVAGIGNNGGDALVIARLLHQKGYIVETSIIDLNSNRSPDLKVNLDRLHSIGAKIKEITSKKELSTVNSNSVIVDGLFGSGLTRPAEDLAAEVIQWINAAKAEVISIDIPSGLFADQATTSENVVHAEYSLTFQAPKLSFLLPGSQEFVGEWSVLDIGLDLTFLDSEPKMLFVKNIDSFKSGLQRKRFDHKGSFGHGLLVAGRYGSMGAAILAAKAALKGGIGKLTVHVPQNGYDVMQESVPEAMCSIDTESQHISNLGDISSFSDIAVGPGLGTHFQSAEMLKALMTNSKRPLVLDADALNIISQHRDWLEKIPPNSILTPHIGEFERLFGTSTNEFERLELLKEKARLYKVIIVLKGAYSITCAPDGRLFFNSTGNPGMATAGSGDVLTGLMLALMAQLKNELTAAIAAVFLHGLAGDIASEEQGIHGLIATDIVNFIPSAFNQVMHSE